jgi:hypothetical protein
MIWSPGREEMSSTVMAYGKKGFRAVVPEALGNIPTPEPTKTWQPIPHSVLCNSIYREFDRRGMEPSKVDVRVSKDGLECFGVLDFVGHHGLPPGMGGSVGFRNANNKRMSAGICAGSNVFVCSNRDFMAEHRLLEIHRPGVFGKLDEGIRDFASKIGGYWQEKAATIGAMQEFPLDAAQAHHVVILGLDRGVITAGEVPKVLEEWRHPEHSQFDARNLWSLYNGFTAVLKPKFDKNPVVAAERTAHLNGIVSDIQALTVT